MENTKSEKVMTGSEKRYGRSPLLTHFSGKHLGRRWGGEKSYFLRIGVKKEVLGKWTHGYYGHTVSTISFSKGKTLLTFGNHY